MAIPMSSGVSRYPSARSWDEMSPSTSRRRVRSPEQTCSRYAARWFGSSSSAASNNSLILCQRSGLTRSHPLRGLEDQEILIGEKLVFRLEHQTGRLREGKKLFPRNLMLDRRSHRKLSFVKIDVNQAATFAKRAHQTTKVGNPIRKMMKRIHHQDEIAAVARDQRIARQAENRNDVRHAALLDSFSKHLQHSRFHIDGEHRAASPHFPGNSKREIPRARADVANDLPRLHA